ncbi:hypothetical protein GE061_008483 [Apolygus lucorum]|uniref:C2H2-type domain-containing protein n=1 Tax=Apolygus lucorum TaxID=248454 RepID=A0A8S9WMK9_APOLU|nr:hypothetical protein GE061_008483 [Apolygus lucorum]
MSELGIGTIKEEVESEEDTTEGVIYEEDALVSAKSNDDASDIKASVVEVSSNGEIDHKPGNSNMPQKHVAGHVGDVFGNSRGSKGEKPLVCNLCDYRSLHAGNLRRHKKVHSDNKPYSCDVCGFKTKKPYSLKMHMITHTGQRLLACDQCDYTCNRPQHLKRHMVAHSGEKPFACSICPYRGTDLMYLVAHMKIHADKLYACDKCDYKAVAAWDVKRHAKIHDVKRPLSPESLDYGVLQDAREGVSSDPELGLNVQDPKLRARNRRNRKPYVCYHCDNRARTRGDMKIHLRTHTGEKPHACSLCNYKSTQLGHLRRHMTVHTGEKPYACDMCGGSTVGEFKRHMMTHEDDSGSEEEVAIEGQTIIKVEPMGDGLERDSSTTTDNPQEEWSVNESNEPSGFLQNSTSDPSALEMHQKCPEIGQETADNSNSCGRLSGEPHHRMKSSLDESNRAAGFLQSCTADPSVLELHQKCPEIGQETAGTSIICGRLSGEPHHRVKSSVDESNRAAGFLQSCTADPSVLELHQKCPEIGQETAGTSIICGRLSGEPHHRMKSSVDESNRAAGFLQSCTAEQSVLGMHQKCPEIGQETAGTSIICGRLSGEPHHRMKSSVDESNRAAGFLQSCTADPSVLELHQKCPEIGQETAGTSIICGRLSGEPHHRMKSSVDESNRAPGFLQSCTAEQSVLGMHQKCPEIGQETAGTSIICGRLSGEPHHRMKSSVDESNRAAGFLQSCTAEPSVLGMHQKCPEIGQETAGNSIICGRLSGEPHHRVKSSVDESNRAAGFLQSCTAEQSGLGMHQKCPEIGQETAGTSIICGRLSGEPHHRMKSSVDESNRAAGFLQSCTADPSVLELHQKCPEIGQETAGNSIICERLSGEPHHRVKSSVDESNRAAGFLQSCTAEQSVLGMHQKGPEIGQETAGNSIICGRLSGEPHHRMKSSVDESNRAAGFLQSCTADPSVLELHQKCPEIGQETAGNSIICGRLSGEPHHRVKSSVDESNRAAGFSQSSTSDPSVLEMHQKCSEIGQETAENSTTCGGLSGEVHHRMESSFHESSQAAVLMQNCMSEPSVLELHLNCPEIGESSASNSIIGESSVAHHRLKMESSGDESNQGLLNGIAEPIPQLFECHQCEFRGKTLIGLKRHMKMHVGEASDRSNNAETPRKLYIGDMGKASGDVKRHMKTHLNQLVIKEEVVNEQSSAPLTVPGDSPQLTGLLPEGRHLKLPDKLLKSPRIRMPFFCYHCGYRGRTKRNLKVHMRDLKRHVLRHHSKEMPAAHDSLVCEIEGAESEQELTIGDQIIIKEEAMTIDDEHNPNLEASLPNDPLSTPEMSGDQIMASSRDVLEPSVYKPPEAYQSIEAGQLKKLMWSHAEAIEGQEMAEPGEQEQHIENHEATQCQTKQAASLI